MICLRKKYNIDSTFVTLDSIFRKYPDLDPNDPEVDPNDKYKRILIHILIEEDKNELVDFILNKATIKANPNLKDTKTLLTPLCSAINECNLEVVKLLVAAGADLKDTCEEMTPCMWAATQADPSIIKYLCEETEADLNQIADDTNIYGSPMHLACLCK
jgi:ankyrin repeat protein